MGFVVVYVTYENLEDAKRISNILLEKKMVACVNYFPISCSFFWKGDIANENEIVGLFKTRTENWEAVKREVTSLHKYEVPCIIKFEVESNDSYNNWVYEVTEEFN